VLVDYHTHTPLCRHAVGAPEAYVRRAIERGIGEIGFSDHTPMPSWYDPAFRMAADEFPRYLEMVRDVQARFGDRIPIRLGLESDYFPGTESFVREMNARAPFDYVIGSVHYLGDWGFDNPEFKHRYDGRDITQVYREYFEMVKGAARSGLFDILGHPDVIKKFGHRPPGSIDAMLEEALEEVRRAGMALDINTSGLRNPCKEVYPSRRFLEIAHALGIPVTLGSDAHRPEHVGEGFAEAVALLREVGYTQILRFERRRPIPVPLQ
jgi:histidinol-phosphatase (PHP family)